MRTSVQGVMVNHLLQPQVTQIAQGPLQDPLYRGKGKQYSLESISKYPKRMVVLP